MRLTPGAAILWTVLLPGLAHVRLGQPVRALTAFITTMGLLAAGAAIVGDRVWYFQLFEPMEMLAPVLSYVPVQLLPESPNLGGCMVLAFLREAPPTDLLRFDWLRTIRVPVPYEHIGLFLTGASGVVASLWAVDAHWLAQGKTAPGQAAPSPSRAAFCSWILPGSGHALAGQKQKGMLLGAAVILMFLLGLLLSQGHAVDRPLRSAWWIGQILFGGGTAVATVTTAPLAEGAPSEFMDHGVAMCTVAGFMNLIVMIDAYTVTEKRAIDAAAARAGGTA